MPKRHLTVQNKGNEHEQQQQQSSSVTTTRASSKRASTNEPISVKKVKTDEEHIDKENIPKRQNNKPKEPEPAPPVNIIEPIVDDDSDLTDDSDDIEVIDDSEDTDDQFEEEEQHIQISSVADKDDEFEEEERHIQISSVADKDDGDNHPTNKQYIIYKNDDSTKEPFIISKTARYWSRKYRKVLNHVFPDAYGMYVHADFSCYGELEVVENCLFDLTKAVFIVQQSVLGRSNYVRKSGDKVNYILAFRRLEVLTILLDYTDGISGIDDGDRFYDIMRVIGACYVTILRGLLPQIMFSKIENIDENLLKKLNKISQQIPNFKQVLEQAIIIGYLFLTIADVCSAYTKILQMVYYNWVLIMDKTTIDLNEQSNKLNPELLKALKHAISINENDIEHGGKESFDFMKELRTYKGHYGLGGDSYDLSKWSRSDRAVYKLGRKNAFANFWYFN